MKVNANLIKDVFIHIDGDFLAKAVPFLLLPILTRYLSTYDYGVVGNYQSAVSILTSFIGLSSSAWLATEHFRSSENQNNLLKDGLRFVLFTGLFFISICLLCPSSLLEQLGLSKIILFYAATHALGAAIVSLVLSKFQISKKAFHFATLNFSVITLSTAIALWLIIKENTGYLGRIYSFLIAYGLFASYYLFKNNPFRGLFKKSKNRTYRQIIRFGLPLIPHELSSWISNYVDRIFLSSILSVSVAGLYGVVFQICYAYEALLIATNRGIVPYIFEDLSKLQSDPLSIDRIWKRIRLLIGLSTLIFIGALVFLPLLYRHFIGEQYQEGLIILPVLLTAFYFKTYYYLFVNFIFFSKRTHLLSTVTSCVALFQGLLSFILIKKWGLWGPVWATLLGSLTTATIVSWMGIRELYRLNKSS